MLLSKVITLSKIIIKLKPPLRRSHGRKPKLLRLSRKSSKIILPSLKQKIKIKRGEMILSSLSKISEHRKKTRMSSHKMSLSQSQRQEASLQKTGPKEPPPSKSKAHLNSDPRIRSPSRETLRFLSIQRRNKALTTYQ